MVLYIIQLTIKLAFLPMSIPIIMVILTIFIFNILIQELDHFKSTV